MAHLDVRDNPCGSASGAARDAAEKALWRMMSFHDTPMADLDRAARADPGWAMPHLMKAGYLLGLTEPALHEEAAVDVAQARLRIAGATPRERLHLDAVQQLLEGRWQHACKHWDAVLVDHPRDALAMQWAQHWDHFRGDSAALRQRPARALPEWCEDDPLHPYVLALYAFGLEEANLHPQAEEAGRRALAANPRVPWAVRAVAHVMEMQGRYDEGAAWLRQHQHAWAEGNGFAVHLWWHKALFRLEAMDVAGALRIVDAHLSGAALQVTLHRIDAASLMWRLHLMGVDVSTHCAALLRDWKLRPDDAGHYAFNDVHAVLAMLGAGQPAQAEAWLARCAERAMAPEQARGSNHAVAREIGLPLMRSVIAYARGDADAAAAGLFDVRGVATQRFGGSHAQRDLIDQTLIAAAARSRRPALGRALVNERRLAKPTTPLTRYWSDAVNRNVRVQA